MGNIVNRVFDSSGPEGKVRGTPQQIIDKYNQLARDAQLSNDRVAAENFQQHAEHYTRLLGEAQREQEARREQQEAQQNREQQNRNNAQNNQQNRNNEPKQDADPAKADSKADSADVIDIPDARGGDTGLVETPEEKPNRRRRKPAAAPAQSDGPDDDTPQAPAAE